MLTFNEPQLVQDLEKLSHPLRGAFAAACAERLLPAYRAYSVRRATASKDTLRWALDRVWEVASGEKLGVDPEDAFKQCIALVPPGDECECENEGQEYAEDAVVAVACSVRVATSGDTSKALVSATRCYEALDTFLSYELDIDFNSPGAEAAVLGHPLVQAELERQRRDLRDLAAAEVTPSEVVQRVRARAVQEAHLFFGQRT